MERGVPSANCYNMTVIIRFELTNFLDCLLELLNIAAHAEPPKFERFHCSSNFFTLDQRLEYWDSRHELIHLANSNV